MSSGSGVFDFKFNLTPNALRDSFQIWYTTRSTSRRKSFRFSTLCVNRKASKFEYSATSSIPSQLQKILLQLESTRQQQFHSSTSDREARDQRAPRPRTLPQHFVDAHTSCSTTTSCCCPIAASTTPTADIRRHGRFLDASTPFEPRLRRATAAKRAKEYQ